MRAKGTKWGRRRRVLAGAALVAFSTPGIGAQAQTWTGGGGSANPYWSNTGNWSGSKVPNAVSADAVFNGGVTNTTARLDADFTVRSLTFNNGSSATLFLITDVDTANQPHDNSLLLGAGGIVNNTALLQQISAIISLTAGTAFSSTVAGGTLSLLGTTGTNGNSYNTLNLNGFGLTVSGAGNTSIASPIVSSAGNTFGITKNGTGTLTLSGTNTFTGGLTINSGTVSYSADANLGNANNAINLIGGGFLQYAGSTSTTLGAGHLIKLSGSGGVDVANSSTVLTVGTTVGGSTGSLVKAGAGSLLLSGANTFGGTTTITGGTLLVSSLSGLGSQGIAGLSLSDGINGGLFGFTSGNNTISRNFTLTGTGSGFVVVGGADALTLSGSLSGSGNLLLQSAGGQNSYDVFGTITLLGNNTYSGGTTIAGGLNVKVGSPNPAINSSLGTGVVTNFGNLTYYCPPASTAAFDNYGTLNLNVGSFASIINESSATVYVGNTASAGTATITNNGRFDFIGSGNAGAASIVSTGGVLGFGDTSSAGTSVINSTSGINFYNASTAGSAAITNNGTLDLTLHTGGLSIGSLGGAGTVSLGSKTLTVGGLNTSTTISGVVQDGGFEPGSSGSLVKTGTGTLTLSGANTYTGTTTITGGTLLVSSLSALGGQGSAGLRLSDGTNGGLFGLTTPGNTLLVRDFVLTGTGSGFTTASSLGALYLSGNLSGAGSVTFAGSGLINFYGSDTATGATTIAAGSTVYIGDPTHNSTLGTGAVTVNGNLYFLASSATLTNAALTNNSRTTFFNSTSAGTTPLTNNGFLSFQDSSTAALASISNNSGGTVDVSVHTGGLLIGDLGGAGTVSLGANTLTLGGLNTSSTISGTIKDGGASGGTGGTLVKTGAGTLTLTGANTYTGGTTLSGGTLAVGNSNALSTGGVILNGGTLATGGSGPQTVTNAVTLAGSSGLSSGTATTGDVHTPGLKLTGNVTLAAPAALTVTGNTRVGITGVMGEANGTATALSKYGAGTLELDNDNTYNGGTLVAAGTLIVNNAYNRTATGSGTGQGAVTVANGATLTGTYAISGPVQINSGGHLGVGNSIGTSTVSFLSLAGGSVLDFEIGTDGTTSDRLTISSLLTRSGAGQITFALSGEHFADGTMAGLSAGTYTLLTFGAQSGLTAGDFFATGYDAALYTSAFTLTPSANGSPGTVVLTLTGNSAAAPEPSSLVLLLLSGAAVTGFRRRGNNQ